MNPGRSWACTGVLPSTCDTNSVTDSATPGSVSTEDTTSTSGWTGAGLKKWMPRTRSGREVACAKRMIGIDEVFDAKIASSSVTTSSRRAKIDFLISSFSLAASMTSCRSASSAMSVVNRSRALAASLSAAVSLPFSTARASDVSIRA